MSDTGRVFVSLGADVGGKDAHVATHEHVLAFRRLLADKCRGPYSETIKEIALVLRIDGSVQAWHKCGVEGVALQKRNSFATADIYVPQNVWRSNDQVAIRGFLAGGVKAAIFEIAELTKTLDVDLLRENLGRDVHSAIQKFTATESTSAKDVEKSK